MLREIDFLLKFADWFKLSTCVETSNFPIINNRHTNDALDKQSSDSDAINALVDVSNLEKANNQKVNNSLLQTGASC